MQITVPLFVRKKVAEETFKADIKFKTKAQVTQRTTDIGEAFGIGIDDEHEFVIFDNFSVEINHGDVVYITGDSGSGKSLLLKELVRSMIRIKEFGSVITDEKIKKLIDIEKPLIEQVGNNTEEAIKILSMAGLNEAFLMLRKYPELSDGQKYRFRLAKMIDSHADTWIADEFCALLDRDTARVVAYTVQKVARKLVKTVIVATTHTDLNYDLNPDARIKKYFGSDVKVSYRKKRNYYKQKEKNCSLLNKIMIEKGAKNDYKELQQFHYIHGALAGTKAIYRARLGDEVVGVIVYGTPYPSLRPRNMVLPMFKNNGKITSKYMRMINQNFVRIWRVVVKPKYRSIGLGVKLVQNTLHLLNTPYVEIMAVMANYNPFPEKAGMMRVPTESYINHDKGYLNALKKLQELGFDLDLLRSKNYCISQLTKLTKQQQELVRKLVYDHFSIRWKKSSLRKRVHDGDLDATADALASHRLPYAYLIWKNPHKKFKKYPEPEIPINQ